MSDPFEVVETKKKRKPIYKMKWPYVVLGCVVVFIATIALFGVSEEEMIAIQAEEEARKSAASESSSVEDPISDSTENEMDDQVDSELQDDDDSNGSKSLDEAQEELEEAWEYASESVGELIAKMKETFWEVWHSPVDGSGDDQ